ncbi:MAG: hypothetical protein QM741_10220 [Rudaea sp.]|uniref:hypothetical protein n=1 Tax=Rudaea sp. TaxID=2136325 RepID=UPI0039E3C923
MKCLRTAVVLSTSMLALMANAWAGETQTYKYDELGRLKSVQYTGTVNNGQAHSTCFDPAGNRTVYRSDAGGALATCPAGSALAPADQPSAATRDSGGGSHAALPDTRGAAKTTCTGLDDASRQSCMVADGSGAK